MKIKNILLLLISVVLVLSALACAQPAQPSTPTAPAPPPAKQSWPKLTFNTAPSGTSNHTLAVVWATLATKYLPGMQIMVEPSIGAPQAVIGFLQGKGDISYDTSSISATELPKYYGGKTMASVPQHLVTALGTGVHIITKADSGVTSR